MHKIRIVFRDGLAKRSRDGRRCVRRGCVRAAVGPLALERGWRGKQGALRWLSLARTENETQTLRGLPPTGEKGNRSRAPSGRSWRNLCASESSKELRIATGSTATPRCLRPLRVGEVLMRYLFGFICVAALGVMGCGETEGTDGGGGSAGTGGEVQNIALTKCALGGYGDLEALWSTTKNIIHYIHHVQPLDSKIKQQLAALPDLDALPPIEELNDGTPKPRVLWSTFSLNLEENQTQPEREIKVYVYQGLDEGIYGREDDPTTTIDESFPRGFSVDDGLYQGRIAVLDWRIDDVKDEENEVPPVGAGTFSVVGLGPVTNPPSRTYYAARVGIIRFPECIVPDSPPDVSVLWSDPKVPDTSNDNPYFDEEKCRFSSSPPLACI